MYQSAKRAFPNSAYSRYKEVEVLLIRWEEDELEVEWELNELHKVFRDLYGFTTEQFLIPSQNSHRKLNLKALRFVEEHENEDTLLIVYYGGHGVINKARQSTWSWYEQYPSWIARANWCIASGTRLMQR